MAQRRALIVGCGVAGPATALFLQRAGIESAIFELQPGPSSFAGAFLHLAANGMAVLQELGLAEQIRSYGVPCKRLVFQNGYGRSLGQMEFATHNVVIKRRHVHQVLHDAATSAHIPIAYNKKLINIEFKPTSVVAEFADGSKEEGDFIIGCDGLHSRVRRSAFPTAPEPAYTGMMSVCGFVHKSDFKPTSDEFAMTFGRRAFFGHVVKPSSETYWFSNVPWEKEPSREELAKMTNEQWKDIVLNLHADDPAPTPEMIRCTEPVDIGVYPTYDIPSLPQWHRDGRVILIGDAAHATSPHAGQGASMALEDAAILAKCLRDIPDSSNEAFATYQQLRKDRVEKLVDHARRTGAGKLSTNRVMLWLRDRLMPLAMKWFVTPKSQSWIHDYDIKWNEKVQPLPTTTATK